MTMRRSPPACMPATPTSQPLMTEPSPMVKLNGLPFLFAGGLSAWAYFCGKGGALTVEDFSILELSNVPHSDLAALLRSTSGA